MRSFLGSASTLAGKEVAHTFAYALQLFACNAEDAGVATSGWW